MSCGHIRGWIGTLFGVVSQVRLGSGVLDFGGDRRRGRGSLGGEFSRQCNPMDKAVLIMVMIDDRLVCEKLAVFLYARYTVKFSVKFPFLGHSQVQDRTWG